MPRMLYSKNVTRCTTDRFSVTLYVTGVAKSVCTPLAFELSDNMPKSGCLSSTPGLGVREGRLCIFSLALSRDILCRPILPVGEDVEEDEFVRAPAFAGDSRFRLNKSSCNRIIELQRYVHSRFHALCLG